MDNNKKRSNLEMRWIGQQVTKMLIYPRWYKKLFFDIKKRIYIVIGKLNAEVIKSVEPIPFNELSNYKFEPISIGDKWGKFFDCGWFRFRGTVPEAYRGLPIAAIIDVKGEGCVMDKDGTPLKGTTRILSVSDGLNTVSGKKVVELGNNIEDIEIILEAGNNGFSNMNTGAAKLKRADIAVINKEMYDLYFDFLTLFTLMIGYAPNDKKHLEIKSSICKAAKVLCKYTKEEVKQAKDILAVELNKKSYEDDLTLYATGHAHLDLAWLWPIRETKRKAGRTFSNQLDLMEQFPDYVYCASQPQMYKWVKEMYPKLYQKVKDRVESGNIEPVGGMWVEPDCNVPSGESLVRQMLYGKRFFRKEFNQDMKVLFLPDVFGFNGNLPQIMRKSGVEYFLTSKMSWNEFTEFPYHTFNWKGIDGSVVLSHMPPAGNYNSDTTGYYLNVIANNYKQKETGIASLLFGAGDGGGGPCEVQLEMLKRQESLEGVVKVKKSKVIDLFLELNKKREFLPEWKGELFLEKHNGTLTTQAKTKYYNRKIEIMLHKVEFLATMAWLLKGVDYPEDLINNTWEELLLYQFHDILPGSSINRVYAECVPRYQEMLKQLEEMRDSLCSKLTKGKSLSALNATSFKRGEWVNADGKWHYVDIEPYSSAELNNSVQPSKVGYDEFGIYSDKLKVKFWTDGSISSIEDVESAKEYAGSRMNRLSVYKDKRMYFDAWDINHKYVNKSPSFFKLKGYNTFIDGPKVIRRQFLSYNKSTIIQDIILTEGSPLVEFVTQVDWHERHRMLRADFLPSVFSDQVTCDIQYGAISRSTKTETLAEYAQFEICAHKWVDVSNKDCGIALLNDCKYGYRVKNGLISLNLLRSTVWPDKTADIGRHNISYALYPHSGDYKESELVKLGYAFNYPLEIFNGEMGIDRFVCVDNSDIVIEAIKKAEDKEGIIVRLYESKGREAKANLKLSLQGYKAYNVNMIEDVEGEIDIESLVFTPFEIKTILFLKDEIKTKVETPIVEEEKTEEKTEDIERQNIEISIEQLIRQSKEEEQLMLAEPEEVKRIVAPKKERPAVKTVKKNENNKPKQ